MEHIDSKTNKFNFDKQQLLEFFQWLSRDEALPELLEFFNQDSRKSQLRKETVNNTFPTITVEKILLQLSRCKITNLSKTECRILDLFVIHKALTLEELKYELKIKYTEYPRRVCQNFLTYDWLKLSSRKRFQGAPFHIYHLPYAETEDLDKAEARYLKLTPEIQTGTQTTPLQHIKEIKKPRPPMTTFECIDCNRTFRREKKPVKCPGCDGEKITIFKPNTGPNQCRHLVFDPVSGKQRQCSRQAKEGSLFCETHLDMAKREAIDLNEGNEYQMMTEEEGGE